LTGDSAVVTEYIGEVIAQLGDDERKPLEEKLKEGSDGFAFALRQVVLQTMDMYWVEHLEVMDYMRSSVNLRAYGQRDPLTEYKREGLRLFKEMEGSIENQICRLIPQIQTNTIFAQETTELREAREGARALTEEKQVSLKSLGQEVGRNDPCPCGAINPKTGEVYKYKKCGMIHAPYHKG
jgi:preprotein translocase subunit SecA